MRLKSIFLLLVVCTKGTTLLSMNQEDIEQLEIQRLQLLELARDPSQVICDNVTRSNALNCLETTAMNQIRFAGNAKSYNRERNIKIAKDTLDWVKNALLPKVHNNENTQATTAREESNNFNQYPEDQREKEAYQNLKNTCFNNTKLPDSRWQFLHNRSFLYCWGPTTLLGIGVTGVGIYYWYKTYYKSN